VARPVLPLEHGSAGRALMVVNGRAICPRSMPPGRGARPDGAAGPGSVPVL